MNKQKRRISFLLFTTLMVLIIAVISYIAVVYNSSASKLKEHSTIIKP